MNSGEILLLNYPFTDASGSKLRPALVVSAARFNSGEDIVVVPISSQPQRDLTHAFPIADTATWFRSTGLRRSSFIKWTKPFTISKRLAARRLGALPAEILTRIHQNLRELFSAG